MSDEPAPEPPSASPTRSPWIGYAALAIAVAVAIGVGAYLFTTSGAANDTAPQSLDGTPIGSLLDATPEPNTGVLDPARPKIGDPAPDFALIDARDGTTVRKLSDFRGTPVVINFFFADCTPCKLEIPDYQAAQTALGQQIVFLGVDPVDSHSRATSFLADLKSTYPAVIDSGAKVNDHYRVTGWPVSFFVDKDGILRDMHTGQITAKALPDYLAKIGLTYTAP